MPLHSDLAVDLPKAYPSQAESSTPTFIQAGEGALQPQEAQDRISLVPPTGNAATFDRASQGDSGKHDSNASRTLVEASPIVSAIDGQVGYRQWQFLMLYHRRHSNIPPSGSRAIDYTPVDDRDYHPNRCFNFQKQVIEQLQAEKTFLATSVEAGRVRH